jgi:hypothetical protein
MFISYKLYTGYWYEKTIHPFLSVIKNKKNQFEILPAVKIYVNIRLLENSKNIFGSGQQNF